MGFCIKAGDATEARFILRELNGKLELGTVPSTLIVAAAQLDDATAYVGHDDVEWKASNTPWGEPLTLPEFVELYQGDVTVEPSGEGYLLSTELARVRVNERYERLRTEGLMNGDRTVVRALELLASAPNVSVGLQPLGAIQSWLVINGQQVAVRQGAPATAREYLKQHSTIFKELL